MDRLIGIFWNRSQQRLRAGWRVVFQFVVAAACFIGFMIGTSIAFKMAGVDTSSPWLMMLGGVVQNVIFGAIVILACIFLDRRRSFKDLGLRIDRRWWMDLLGGLLVGGVLMGVIFAIQYQQGMITLGESAFDWNQILLFQLGWFVTMCFVGAGEELLSRGYQLKNLTEGFQKFGFFKSFLVASVVSSAVFGVLHMMNPNATVIATVSIMLAGLMFCVGRICTGSLAAPIGMHIAWNYFQGAIFGFPVSGQKMQGSLFTIDKTIDSPWSGGEFGPENSLMGLIAILITTLVFVFWPKTKTNYKENLVDMVRFRRRVPTGSNSNTIAAG
ncbi:MAG: lysostaphin resistance A-like protein [Mariniblastus sp.]